MNDESLATAVSPAPLSAGLASPAGNSAAAGSTNSNSSGKNDPDANLEEVLLELTSFEKEISKAGSLLDLSIPSSLESYLKLVANAGSAQFPWTKIKPLFRVKLEQVIHEFNTSSPTSEIPAMPNVDAFNFDAVKGKVFEQLEAFVGIPFTVQRLAELLTTPRRHYRRTDKFMRALEKNMLVVSTVEARAVAAAASDLASHSLINGSDHSVLPVTSSPLRRAASPTSSGFVKASKLANNDKEAKVNGGGDDDEEDEDGDKPMDDSSSETSSDQSPQTTPQKATPETSDSPVGELSVEHEAVQPDSESCSKEDKMETEDSGEEAASGTASAEKEAASTVGDVASSSSDVEAEKSAQQSEDSAVEKPVETPVGTTTNDDDDAAKNATPDKGEPDTDDGGPCDSADEKAATAEPESSEPALEPTTEKSEVGSSEPREDDSATSSEAKDDDKPAAAAVGDSGSNATSSNADDNMEVDADCSSTQTPILTSSN